MNIINSRPRWSLHPDGRLQDNKTDALFDADDVSVVSDGTFDWDLVEVRAVLSGNGFVEDAIAGPSTGPRMLSSAPKAPTQAPASDSQEAGDEQTDNGEAEGTA